MKRERILAALAVAVGLGLASGGRVLAQEAKPARDDAVDSLLKEISGESAQADRAGKKADGSAKKAEPRTQDKGKTDGKPSGRPSASTDGKPGTKDQGAGKAAAKPARPADKLTVKDQEVDDLLEKLGETKETPAPEERPRGGPGAQGKPEGGPSGGKPDERDKSKLSDKDKKTDEHLEELTGRKRRKKDEDEERSGPAGEIIKEMRDIEQKLSKPDTGEGTREEQKKVVKRIDTLIEEMKKSGQSGMGRMVVRRVRRPGQQPGQQPEGTEGAMARGAPLQKPAKPTTKHADSGGKDIWGHLPAAMRAEIENMWNELPLSTRQELIERYYTSINKGELVREAAP